MSVYFARVKGYVKIGYSGDPRSRVTTITSTNVVHPDDIAWGDEVDLLGWVPGDRKVEKTMHMRFGALHVVGEWFWDDDAFDQLILDDPCGVPHHDVADQVAAYMLENPSTPRTTVIEAWNAIRAAELADPASVHNRLSSMFGGDGGIDRLTKFYADRRAADRAYWRSQRTAA